MCPSASKEMFEVDRCIQGYHIFKNTWNPTVGDTLVSG